MTQPTVDTDLSALIAAVRITDVRLIDSSVRTRIRDANLLRNPQLAMKHGAKVIGRNENGILVGAMMRAQVLEGTDEQNPAVSMTVTFALEYAVPHASRFPDEVLAEFARVNSTFNAWPYWREYIQTTSARMNLPPLVLPVFRVGRKEARETTVSSDNQPSRRRVHSTASRHKPRRPKSA